MVDGELLEDMSSDSRNFFASGPIQLTEITDDCEELGNLKGDMMLGWVNKDTATLNTLKVCTIYEFYNNFTDSCTPCVDENGKKQWPGS